VQVVVQPCRWWVSRADGGSAVQVVGQPTRWVSEHAMDTDTCNGRQSRCGQSHDDGPNEGQRLEHISKEAIECMHGAHCDMCMGGCKRNSHTMVAVT
jgi:sulfatase maturation enzyme AslB (radical SAM superfamily)